MSDKPTYTEKLKEITDKLEQGIQDLFNSDKYTEYLNTMAKFHNYSFRNTMLIAIQNPQASFVAGYGAWQTKFKRQVRKGEKGIKILAPSPYKTTVEKDVFDKDGNAHKEEQEIIIPAFKLTTVFDVSQTDGEELPTLGVNQLVGEVADYSKFFDTLKTISPVPIAFEDIKSGAKGYYHLEEKRIAIKENMSELQTVKTAIHEIAHAKLHALPETEDEKDKEQFDRRTREVQAESVAYTVCQHFGIDTSDYSFGYIAGWSSGRETEELKSSLELIRNTAAEFIDAIEDKLLNLDKEISKEDEIPDKEQPDDLNPAIQPVVTIQWSESPDIPDGLKLPLHKADRLLAELDAKHTQEAGYDKTSFGISYTHKGIADTYTGRYDIGDGEDGIIDHIQKYYEYYRFNEAEQGRYASQGPEVLAEHNANCDFALNELVPYFKMHSSLSVMESAAMEGMQSDEKSMSEKAYYNAVCDYVSECRKQINNTVGAFDLPEAPKKDDYIIKSADELEQQAKIGESVPLMDMVDTIKTEKAIKQKTDKKPSIRKQLAKDKALIAQQATQKKEDLTI